MLNKSIVWVFGTKTIEAMLSDLNQHFEEIKSDPTPPSYLGNAHLVRDLLTTVLAEKQQAIAGD